MKNKYNYTNFLISDIHSFATPLQSTLKQAGFNRNDKTHRLVILGDLFDRGPETLKVYKFIKNLPKHRRVLIKGNHEDLYLELLEKKFPDRYDFSNGTVDTFCQIAGVDINELDFAKCCKKYYEQGVEPPRNLIRANIDALWKTIKTAVAQSEITKWLNSAEWLNYFELNNLICVHSFIPTLKFEYFLDWRNATKDSWDAARWGCPWEDFKSGLFDLEIKKGKTLVCGHWHTADFHRVFENKTDDFSIYLGKNLIALDGCVAYTGKANVLKITPDGQYLKFGN